MTARLGVIGARGHAGVELLRLVARHPRMELGYAASRAHAGKPLQALAPDLEGAVAIAEPDPRAAAEAGLDACVLAMPNGASAPYVAAFERVAPETVLVDLSADHRFDEGWCYGLPELDRSALRGARRIANPGCYATAVQLALKPFVEHLAGPASAFAVSGYSGAGTTPSPRNDPERLADSIMPYALIGHGHEGEIRRHLGAAVNFTPHVAGFFRGIVATVHAPVDAPLSLEEAGAMLKDAYADEPLVRIQDAPPELRDGRDHVGAVVGGLAVAPDERRVAAACALDNLLKGAASQALQNVNLALGLPELAGLAERAASDRAAE